MMNDGVAGALAKVLGTVDGAGDFDFALVFLADAFRVVVGTECFGGIVAAFLESMNLAGEAAEDGDGSAVLLGIRGELLAGFGSEEELREIGGGGLDADLGELACVGGAEMGGEVVLVETLVEGALLFGRVK